MVSHQFNVESLRDILWDPKTLRKIYPDCIDEDVEVLKASLMLQSVLSSFKEIRLERNQWIASYQSLQDEKTQILTVNGTLKQKLEQLQSDNDSLRSKLDAVMAVKDSESLELNRLRQQLAQKVDERAKSIFLSCLRKNSTTTVLDWMTQMHQDSQPFQDECEKPHQKFVSDEEIFDSSDIVGATPDSNKKVRKKKNSVKELKESNAHYKTGTVKNSASVPRTPICRKRNYLSSPDEIGGTPDVYIDDKCRQKIVGVNKIKKGSSLLGSEVISKSYVPLQAVHDENEHFVSLDTQEMEPESVRRSACKEMFVIPETFHPKGLEMEINDLCAELSSNKEPEEITSPNKSSPKTIANISLDQDFPTTPEKKIKSRTDSSPILGSGRKTLSQKSSDSASLSDIRSPSLLSNKCSSFKSSGTEAKMQNKPNMLGLSKSRHLMGKESCTNKAKKLRQTVLTSFSEIKQSKDISDLNEFNGGQRHSDLKKDICNSSEEEQMRFAVKASLNENDKNDDSLLQAAVKASLEESKRAGQNQDEEDFDVTYFSPILLHEGEAPNTTVKIKRNTKDVNAKNSDESIFDPKFTSTEKTPSPLKAANFNEPFKKCVQKTVLQNKDKHKEEEINFNPLFTSTEIEGSENSALAELVGMIQDSKVIAHPSKRLDSSFDRVPKKGPPSPNYKYQGKPVRKKNERLRLKAWDCPECREFNHLAGYDVDDPKTRHLLQRCSRHRSKHGMRRPSPEGFWNPDCPSTPEKSE